MLRRKYLIPFYLLFGLVLSLIFFELFPDNLLRGGYWENGCMKWDDITGYRLTPGTVVCSKLFDFKTLLKIGKDGFRCTYDLNKTSDAPIRIILLGDSQPFSPGCEEEDSLPTQLEKDLFREYHLNAVCYNLSLPSASLLGQLGVLVKYASAIRPTHVIYWGKETDADDIYKQSLVDYQNQIAFGYYSQKWVSFMRNSALIKYSGMVRGLSSMGIWDVIKITKITPKAVDDFISMIAPKQNAAKGGGAGFTNH